MPTTHDSPDAPLPHSVFDVGSGGGGENEGTPLLAATAAATITTTTTDGLSDEVNESIRHKLDAYLERLFTDNPNLRDASFCSSGNNNNNNKNNNESPTATELFMGVASHPAPTKHKLLTEMCLNTVHQTSLMEENLKYTKNLLALQASLAEGIHHAVWNLQQIVAKMEEIQQDTLYSSGGDPNHKHPRKRAAAAAAAVDNDNDDENDDDDDDNNDDAPQTPPSPSL